MKARAHVVMAATAAIILAAVPAIASSWSATGSAVASSQANSLSAPNTATVGSATPSTLTISVKVAPNSGPTPTAYRVDMTSPGTNENVCTITAVAGVGNCTNSGLSAGTTYTYAVYSQIGTKWISAGSASGSGTTSATYVALKFVNCAINGGTTGSCSSVSVGNRGHFTGQLQATDVSGNPVNVASTTTVNLTTDKPQWTATNVTISAGGSLSTMFTVTYTSQGTSSTVVTATDVTSGITTTMTATK